WDKEMCVRCGLCYIFCPDAAIKRGDDGYYEADLDYCKGCGICHRECWFGAISMTEEK
ncbi:MAG: 4Fe-4S binding protein, partial [Deltaproteobacteria bacterium]|nr:4Fe-4S binding protein [Deltaproteobacteria bacterium]